MAEGDRGAHAAGAPRFRRSCASSRSTSCRRRRGAGPALPPGSDRRRGGGQPHTGRHCQRLCGDANPRPRCARPDAVRRSPGGSRRRGFCRRRDDRCVRRARRPCADQGPCRRRVLPALLAMIDGALRRAAAADRRREFMTCLCLGYEIATRAGIALHATRRGLSLLGRVECSRLRRHRRAPPRVRSPRGCAMRSASPNTSARAARSCVLRVPDHGQGWLQLGCARRSRRGVARA